MTLAALIVLAVVIVALVVWNVATVAHAAEATLERDRTLDQILRSITEDLRRSRVELAGERQTHVEQIERLLVQQATEREQLLTAALTPDERTSLAKLGITAATNVDIAKARAARDDLVLAGMERGRAESRYEDITGG
jgi:hypothetical protein